jgi:hypothetical protein
MSFPPPTTETPAPATPAPQPQTFQSYVTLPPDIPVPEPIFSIRYVLFVICVMTVAVVLGLHGKIPFINSGPDHKPGTPEFVSATMAAFHAAPSQAATPIPPPPPGTFIVTSLSAGPSGFAIINGHSYGVGDAVADPGASGWTIREIEDGDVILQNGATVTAIPLTDPGLKPLDDTLHPLN